MLIPYDLALQASTHTYCISNRAFWLLRRKSFARIQLSPFSHQSKQPRTLRSIAACFADPMLWNIRTRICATPSNGGSTPYEIRCVTGVVPVRRRLSIGPCRPPGLSQVRDTQVALDVCARAFTADTMAVKAVRVRFVA